MTSTNASREQGAVRYSVVDRVAVLTIDHPPVNALSIAVRRGLAEAVARAMSDPSADAVLLIGAGKAFIGGADIRELGKPPQPPGLSEVCQAIEASPKPFAVAIAGPALGGGLEIALAAHHRLALGTAKLGLPEVLLGLLPGAGGTQRAPRLIGVKNALDLMLSGRSIGAEEALRMGLVDDVAPGSDPEAEGLAFVRRRMADGAPPRRARDQAPAEGDRASQEAALAAARAEAQKARGLFSPMKIVEAVQAAVERPFDEGLRIERSLFVECLASPQREGLIHAFFAEREVRKAPETEYARPRPLAELGVVGGGTMGVGIAAAMLEAGFTVTMVERDEAALAQATSKLERIYDGLIAKSKITPGGRAEALARFHGSVDFSELKSADLVVEAVFEELEVKREVFGRLDAVCKPGAVLASNTSYLDIDRIARATWRPADVVGLHFFSPAHVMRLLEIVVSPLVDADVVATGFELARRLNKVPVRAGVCDGFIGNRILSGYRRAADAMVEDGASPYEIDAMARAFGFPMGPYQVADLAGGDIGWAARKRRAPTRNPQVRYVQIPDRLCERGWFGQKVGRGWYRYPEGQRTGIPDLEVEAIIAEERARAGVKPRTFTREELQRRYLTAMINEAANVVLEGIALRPLDVDVVLVHGYGFPRYRGGPMKYADMVGLGAVLADLRALTAEDALFWSPSPLLVELVERGATFESLNRQASRKPPHA
jgi:3-hydroxyacyl-CoA dehydrogenase